MTPRSVLLACVGAAATGCALAGWLLSIIHTITAISKGTPMSPYAIIAIIAGISTAVAFAFWLRREVSESIEPLRKIDGRPWNGKDGQ